MIARARVVAEIARPGSEGGDIGADGFSVLAMPAATRRDGQGPAVRDAVREPIQVNVSETVRVNVPIVVSGVDRDR